MPTPPEIIASLEGDPDPDAKVLFHLAQAGSDLTKPHKPDFALFLDSEAAAKAAEWELAERGFETSIEPPDENHDRYLVVGVTTLVPTLARIQALPQEFYALADELDGDYDGWVQRQSSKRSNRAMQRTASQASVYAMSVCHPPFGSVAHFTGLAVPDLVSR
ncbi:MAG: ribonuclease E inhibitor RraB [Candidatus Udaeobacter sp.]